MITLDLTLPEGALLGPATGQAAPGGPSLHPGETGAVWFAACAPTLQAGKPGTWRSFPEGDPVAEPVQPHCGSVDMATGGGVRFAGGINAGWVVQGITQDMTQATLALRVDSSGDARSLATLNPRDGGTYLFLAEKGGLLSWQDDADLALPLTQPATGGKRWVLASYAKGALALAEGVPAAPIAPAPAVRDLTERMAGPLDLFIGCRSHRRGILKTLGDFVLHDLLIWPDRDCLTVQDGLHQLQSAIRFVEAERP